LFSLEDDYNHLIISPWIHSIYNLFLAALLKSEQLNVQEAAVEVLCSYFDYGKRPSSYIQNSFLMSIYAEYGRSEFLRLNYIDSLLSILEDGDEVLQIAVVKLL